MPQSAVNPLRSKGDVVEFDLPSGGALSDTVHLAHEQQLFLCFPGALWQLAGGSRLVPGPGGRLWCWSEGARSARGDHPHPEYNVLSTHAKHQREGKVCHFLTVKRGCTSCILSENSIISITATFGLKLLCILISAKSK